MNGSGHEQNNVYEPQYGPADIAKLCQAAGLDPETCNRTDYLVHEGFPALIELFSDGEMRIVNLSKNVDAIGPGASRHGEFFTRFAKLRQLAAKDPVIAAEINKLERFVGSYLAELVLQSQVQLPDQRLARPELLPDGQLEVQLADYIWRSSGEPAVVIEYGPGLVGRSFLDLQLIGLVNNSLPLQYLAISKGPFVNQFLLRYLTRNIERLQGLETANRFIEQGLFIGREDGMKKATSELLRISQSGGNHAMTDLILLSGVHQAEPDELKHTLQNSRRLLKPDGRLMLSAPIKKVTHTTTTFSQQLAWARGGGYQIEWQDILETGSLNLGTRTVSGCAVLTK